MAAPEFSIVIPHRDDLDGLRRSLESLSGMMSGRRPFEVIVVDNGSAEGAQAVQSVIAAHAPFARMIVESTLGAGPARNCGALNAQGAILVFLDCDCVPEAGWLDKFADELVRHDIVGGPVRVHLEADAIRSASAAALFDLLFGFQSEQSFHRDGMLLTANLAIPRAVFWEVGPFRSGTSEDRDWCVRARQAGFDLVLCATVSVQHNAVDDARALQRRWSRITRESFVFYREQERSRLRWACYCFAVAASPFVHGLKIFLDKRLQGVPATKRASVIRLLFECRMRRSLLGLSLFLASA